MDCFGLLIVHVGPNPCNLGQKVSETSHFTTVSIFFKWNKARLLSPDAKTEKEAGHSKGKFWHMHRNMEKTAINLSPMWPMSFICLQYFESSCVLGVKVTIFNICFCYF